MVGDGVTVLLQRAFPTVRDQEGLREIFDTYYAAHCSSETELYPDVLSTLNALKAAGKELVVITNKPQRFTAPMLINLELQEFFTVVYCGDTFDYKKPDPRVMQKLLGSRSIPAHDALMVGDSSNDIHCAAEAGVDSVLVMYGYGVEGALQSHIKPTYTVESLQELLQL
ncbi:phosphoglycolate phosphatase [Desulfurispira natronophila]|uniref:phosphoglycolate phosphatase n=2 Tax=Desulfurispira natronophila TaxID=682562 RepID=A0A7W8DG11_9BACT|nr:phosphoglycolate phosphatase [Desulfurispira natronophila]